jgi:hypothetical protein
VENGDLGNTPCINLCRPFGAVFTIYPQWREAVERVVAAQMARDATEPGTPQREAADKEYQAALGDSRALVSTFRLADLLREGATRGPVYFRSICATGLCVPYIVQAPAKNQEGKPYRATRQTRSYSSRKLR